MAYFGNKMFAEWKQFLQATEYYVSILNKQK